MGRDSSFYFSMKRKMQQHNRLRKNKNKFNIDNSFIIFHQEKIFIE
jgi:hypothetical protein